MEFYPHRINHDGIIIDGHTGNISFEAMRWIVKHGINLSLLNWNGNLLASTLPEEPKSGNLKIKQYQKYLDSDFRYNLASKIIQTKIIHSQNLIEQLSKYHDVIDVDSITNTILKENRHKINNKYDSISDLMTYEGRIAMTYFVQLTKLFGTLAPEFNFKVRKNKSLSRNYNASDEINALLNYGYAILKSEIRRNLNSVGLDCTIGFLHEITPSRTPLVYDLQELFRWLIDLSVIQLLEDKILKKSDFIVTESYNLRLREKTAKLLIEKINSNFNAKAPYKDKKYHYQNILSENIRSLALYISDKKKVLDFDIPLVMINRNDTSLLRERILSMTPEKRRKLGINKSTLWYMKKNLTDGQKIKIYDKVLSKINTN